MIRSAALLLGFVALAAYAAQGSASSWYTGAEPAPPLLPPPDSETAYNTVNDIMEAPSFDQRLAAFLAAIRRFESNNDYTILYGRSHFSSFDKHPRIAIPITIPGYEGKKSTAAGAYQINWPTYTDFAPGLGITDFSPASQDAIALAIVKRTGAYDALIAGDVAEAFRLASSRWASLPGSLAKQNPQSESTVLSWFEDYLNENT